MHSVTLQVDNYQELGSVRSRAIWMNTWDWEMLQNSRTMRNDTADKLKQIISQRRFRLDNGPVGGRGESHDSGREFRGFFFRGVLSAYPLRVVPSHSWLGDKTPFSRIVPGKWLPMGGFSQNRTELTKSKFSEISATDFFANPEIGPHHEDPRGWWYAVSGSMHVSPCSRTRFGSAFILTIILIPFPIPSFTFLHNFFTHSHVKIILNFNLK